MKWPPGQEAGHSPHGRTRIAAIYRVGRLMDSGPAVAVNAESITVAIDFYAHLAKRLDGARVVIAAGQIKDPATPDGDAAENHRAVRDRLVAGHADVAA